MKLHTKLIIAFSSIVLLMALVQSLFFNSRMVVNFEDFIKQNEAESIEYWKDTLMNYYNYSNDWEGVQEFLDNNFYEMKPRKGRMGMGIGGPGFGGMSNAQILIADDTGSIIGDTQKEFIGKEASELEGVHEDLILNNKKIGEFIFIQKKSIGLITIEQQFIHSSKLSIIISAIISVILSIIVGALISNRITKPLGKLMLGIKNLAKGDTKYRVKVSSKDEFHELANAFNHMSGKIEKNEEIRKALVADVAHELRTPLSILHGKLESIQEGAIQPSEKVIVELNDEVIRLTRLVNDLQQLSLAESGKLQLKRVVTNLNEIIRRVIYNFSWLAEEKQIRISFIEKDKVEANIDSDRMTQVVINLLGNALRHSPENTDLLIYLSRQNEQAVLEIKDNGPGIEETQIPYIFERFYRTDTSRTRDSGGTGLGLSIVKGFIEAHNGVIHVKSEKGKGTTFIVKLPIK